MGQSVVCLSYISRICQVQTSRKHWAVRSRLAFRAAKCNKTNKCQSDTLVFALIGTKSDNYFWCIKYAIGWMQIDPFFDTLSTHHQIFVKRLMTYWNGRLRAATQCRKVVLSLSLRTLNRAKITFQWNVQKTLEPSSNLSINRCRALVKTI